MYRSLVVQMGVPRGTSHRHCPGPREPGMLDAAYRKIGQSLNKRDMVCRFPEGQLSKDGNLMEFRPGILKILEDAPVPVIPARLPDKL